MIWLVVSTLKKINHFFPISIKINSNIIEIRKIDIINANDIHRIILKDIFRSYSSYIGGKYTEKIKFIKIIYGRKKFINIFTTDKVLIETIINFIDRNKILK